MLQNLRFILALFSTFNLSKAFEAQTSFLVADAFSFEEQLNYTDTGDYSMTVNFGTPVQRESGYTFAVDTTIGTILTTTTQCSNCTLKTFNMIDSKSLVNISSEPMTMVLPGNFSVTGLQVKDQVCIISSEVYC